MNAKFFKKNADIFTKYFDCHPILSATQYYQTLINSGQFKKMQQIIADKTEFTTQKTQNIINKLI